MDFVDRFWHHVGVGLATFVGLSWWVGFQILFLLRDIALGLGIVILWPLAVLEYLRRPILSQRRLDEVTRPLIVLVGTR